MAFCITVPPLAVKAGGWWVLELPVLLPPSSRHPGKGRVVALPSLALLLAAVGTLQPFANFLQTLCRFLRRPHVPPMCWGVSFNQQQLKPVGATATGACAQQGQGMPISGLTPD